MKLEILVLKEGEESVVEVDRSEKIRLRIAKKRFISLFVYRIKNKHIKKIL